MFLLDLCISRSFLSEYGSVHVSHIIQRFLSHVSHSNDHALDGMHKRITGCIVFISNFNRAVN